MDRWTGPQPFSSVFPIPGTDMRDGRVGGELPLRNRVEVTCCMDMNP